MSDEFRTTGARRPSDCLGVTKCLNIKNKIALPSPWKKRKTKAKK